MACATRPPSASARRARRAERPAGLAQGAGGVVTAQRDRVVGSYAVLAAIGSLSAQTVDLDVAAYDPSVHFEQVKDKWIGIE